MGQCGLLIYCSIARVDRRAFYIFRALEQWTIEHESIEPMRSIVPLFYCSLPAVLAHLLSEHWSIGQWNSGPMRQCGLLLH